MGGWSDGGKWFWGLDHQRIILMHWRCWRRGDSGGRQEDKIGQKKSAVLHFEFMVMKYDGKMSLEVFAGYSGRDFLKNNPPLVASQHLILTQQLMLIIRSKFLFDHPWHFFPALLLFSSFWKPSFVFARLFCKMFFLSLWSVLSSSLLFFVITISLIRSGSLCNCFSSSLLSWHSSNSTSFSPHH